MSNHNFQKVHTFNERVTINLICIKTDAFKCAVTTFPS